MLENRQNVAHTSHVVKMYMFYRSWTRYDVLLAHRIQQPSRDIHVHVWKSVGMCVISRHTNRKSATLSLVFGIRLGYCTLPTSNLVGEIVALKKQEVVFIPLVHCPISSKPDMFDEDLCLTTSRCQNLIIVIYYNHICSLQLWMIPSENSPTVCCHRSDVSDLQQDVRITAI